VLQKPVLKNAERTGKRQIRQYKKKKSRKKSWRRGQPAKQKHLDEIRRKAPGRRKNRKDKRRKKAKQPSGPFKGSEVKAQFHLETEGKKREIEKNKRYVFGEKE